jgi:hypothetical protein
LARGFHVGLALRFALSASPCGQRRAALRVKPTGIRRSIERGIVVPGSFWRKIFPEKPKERHKRGRTQKGDISNEVRKGTFLKSFDKYPQIQLTSKDFNG